MTHPVDELCALEFQYAAGFSARMLAEFGHSFIVLEPGDGTSYKIAVVKPVIDHGGSLEITNSYWMASNFGALYPVNPMGDHHWTYVDSHYLDDSHEWTARVLARFLNELCDYLKEVT